MRNYFSITNKVVAAMSIVVLSIMLLIAVFTYNQSEKLLGFQMERELSTEIDNIENEVSFFFKQKGEVIRQLAITPVIKEMAKDNEPRDSIDLNPNYEWLQQALTTTYDNNDNINLLWFANPSHSYVIGNHQYVSVPTFDISERPWYASLQQEKGPSYSSPYIDFPTKKLTVSIISPVLIKDTPAAYVGADIHLDALPAILQQFENNDRHIILVSNDGQIIYDKENMWPTLKQEQEHAYREGVMLVNSENGTYYTDIHQVNDLGWKIAIYVPEDVFLAPLLKYQTSLILFWVVALILLLTVLSLVLRRVLKDIPFITKQLEKMEDGDFNINIGLTRNDEIGEISRTVDRMAHKIQIQMQEMDYHARFDALTQLPNRFLIEKTLEEWIDSIRKNEQVMAVAFLDLDHFKQINDTKGHAYGDELLIQVGQRIKDNLPDNSFFGRFGGDEFIILLSVETRHLDKVQRDLEIMRNAFSEAFNLFGHAVHMTTSVGVAFYPGDAKTKPELLANADTALYEAKENGRNRITFFNSETKDLLKKSFTMQRDLHIALDNDELSLHFQPQFDIISGQTKVIEALIQWNHPKKGIISPGDFIPVAEKTGLICEIGDWVIDASLQAIKRIIKEDPRIQRIAVNMSITQLQKYDFIPNLKNTLAKHDVSPSVLEFEITESAIVKNEEDLFRKVEELTALGIHIALDDFGTGYSSLNYLHMMAIDKVKMDRSFTEQLEENTDVFSILESIIELGRNLGFEIVVKGVENEAQLQLLRDMNVDGIQGFYYSRPLNEASLGWFLKSIK